MTDKEKLKEIKKLADAMYYAAQQLTTDASRLHKAMDGYHKFIIHECKEKSVSEELEQAIDTYLATYFGSEQEKQEWPFLKKMAIYFANWQKQKDAETLNQNALLYDARLKGIEIGKAEMKQQMMAKAVDAIVKIDAGGYPYVDSTIELYDYDKDIPLAKRGDKVKVIVIKE